MTIKVEILVELRLLKLKLWLNYDLKLRFWLN